MIKVALGSRRAAKIAAVRSCLARLAELDPHWRDAEVIPREVQTHIAAMPLDDAESMRGARERAHAVRARLQREGLTADFFLGLEGGFHMISGAGERLTLLRNWAYVTDGTRGSFGAGPAIPVPETIVTRVIETGRELGEIIDEITGEEDVRSNRGAWGVFSRGLLSRALSFELALIAAFAPFYNPTLYRSNGT
ncbi:DUF84 family protein [Pyrinomonas methylaliphatogenes]|uniref:inosine/xanthosine triphosphatase n=1 Tax=Pyrinomonas methylaliphatogenes TaxID=454194 RepID=A0A0B6X0U9_9BACT|nr:inosine/xanthosine triphosphatase [Pyrinomonas methylaliphatogenes]MBX5479257.1 DUF84 family protein [Pyrinomonas methylaliphatogenes]CDM66976.1 hypothetical protein PYK22_03024 [Pyrinomonas methylaliphatogenes]